MAEAKESYLGGNAKEYRLQADKCGRPKAAQECCKAVIDAVQRGKPGNANLHDIEAAIAFAEVAMDIPHGTI